MKQQLVAIAVIAIGAFSAPAFAQNETTPSAPASESRNWLGADGATQPNAALAPTYGEVVLEAGFTPDPHLIGLHSGGGIDAAAAPNLGGRNCAGYIAEAPDYRVQYTTSGDDPLIISARSAADTTIVVHTPDSQWRCNDDGGLGLNPSLILTRPQSGQYDIWVGTYGAAALAPAELAISEVVSQ